MKKWMPLAALAAALVVVILVVRAVRRPADRTEPAAEAAAPVDPHAGMPAAGTGPVDPHGGGANPHGGAPGGSEAELRQAQEAAVRAVLAYQVTLPRFRAYAAAIRELRGAGERDPALMARLRGEKPEPYRQAQLGAWLEGIPELKAILDKHGLKGLDLVLMPQAIVSGRAAWSTKNAPPDPGGMHAAAAPPPESVNQSAYGLYQADAGKVGPEVDALLGDLKVISGR